MPLSKRIFDLFWSILGLLLLWPLFILIALGIKRDDGGPVFFRQERIGRQGRPFRMWKFRTMVVDAERLGLPLTVEEDPRITPIGRRMRRWKLDELPQLFNVLCGELSLVGPRPEVTKYVSLYTEEQRRVLDLVPGITDPASMKYENENAVLAKSADPERMYVGEIMPEKIRINLEYAKNRSLLRDTLVISQTILPFVRNRHFFFMVATDGVLVLSSYVVAYLLRFDIQIPTDEWVRIRQTLPFVVPVKLILFFLFGLYRGMWRYTSILDFLSVFKASVAASLVIVLVIVLGYRFEGYARSVYIIDAALTFFLIGGVRGFIRLLFAGTVPTFWTFRRYKDPGAKKLIIIGAGNAGEKALREIRENPTMKLDPVGFLDDDVAKHWKAIHGVPVVGKIGDADRIPLEFDEILIAVPTAKGDEMRRIVAACERTGKRYRTLPPIGELIDGRVSLQAVREVRIEDLLGRAEVLLDRERVTQSLFKKRVLVTGAGGSIGRELVAQICRYRPETLGLLDFSEFNLFHVDRECRERFSMIPFRTLLVDIRDHKAVQRVFADFRPEVVFHAAAYKHVPLQEAHPREAVINNVLGTRNLVLEALACKADRFVFVSTDKAVRPTNVMGATKRVAEMYLSAMNGAATRFLAVRFGNVLGSSGSVLPLFQEQIAQGRPVTVTHPEVTRFFMSIPEAAQLILQAGAMGRGGEIFILDMGRPVRIADMARDLIRLHGLEPEKDIPIHYIGLRPGEKLYEELITEGEGIVATPHEKIRVLQSQEHDRGRLEAAIDALIMVAETHDARVIKGKLREIVPEYTPDSTAS